MDTANTPAEERSTPRPGFSMPGLLLRLEGLAILVAAVLIYGQLGGDWLAFVLLLFVPDVSMLGYVVNARVGAITYNIGHFLALPLILGLLALAGGWLTGVLLALIWLAHIGLDRLLGYGLKYATEFKATHLGRV